MTTQDSEATAFRYYAFISYSHQDKAWADWLHKALETYAVPKRLVGRTTTADVIPKRLTPIFRDRDELASANDLGRKVNEALAQSANLIVICSPRSAASPWVQQEILAYKQLGRGERIFCLIVDGEPNASELPGREAGECFAPALRFQLDADGQLSAQPAEPIAADARVGKDGKGNAKLKLIAGLLDVGFDTLKQREMHRRNRRLAVITSMALVVMALTTTLAVLALISRHDAQRRQAQAESILGFMLGDLRGKLATVGRLDLMVAVDDKAIAYFGTLQPRDLNARALEQQARLLTGIGQVRLDQGHDDKAMLAFRDAYARSSELLRRQPGNGQRLFDRAQAEYWIGFAFWRYGQLDNAETWLRRYRDSALKLAAMDRTNFAWQREVAYGQENLATLDLARGRNKQAERIFHAVYDLYLGWMKTHSHDTGLRDEAANIASYLGTLAMHDGRLVEARARFTEQVEDISANRAAEPHNAQWKSEWPDARLFLVEAQAKSGDFASARRGATAATALSKTLTEQDPTNKAWQLELAKDYWWQARLDWHAAPAQAANEARDAEQVLTTAHTVEPKDSTTLHWLAKSEILLGELAWRDGANGLATNWLSRAAAELLPAVARQQNQDDFRLLPAKLHLLQGNVAAQRGDLASARAAWSAAERELRNGGNPPAFDHLDLLVRVLLAQNRGVEAAAYLATLRKSGYVPLYPWPAVLGGHATEVSK
ncbi:MAG: toll/interleukin-1 receptor domain-containing protein [Rhodanobacter sp.]